MKSPELSEFFSLLGKAKKEKKEEFDNLLKEADINLDVLTSSVVTGIKEAKVNIRYCKNWLDIKHQANNPLLKKSTITSRFFNSIILPIIPRKY